MGVPTLRERKGQRYPHRKNGRPRLEPQNVREYCHHMSGAVGAVAKALWALSCVMGGKWVLDDDILRKCYGKHNRGSESYKSLMGGVRKSASTLTRSLLKFGHTVISRRENGSTYYCMVSIRDAEKSELLHDKSLKTCGQGIKKMDLSGRLVCDEKGRLFSMHRASPELKIVQNLAEKTKLFGPQLQEALHSMQEREREISTQESKEMPAAADS